MRPLLIAFSILAFASAALAESVHVTDDRQLGIGYHAAPIEGRLSGFTVGEGEFDEERVDTLSAMATIPFKHTDLDLVASHLESTTIARGPFSFDGVFFANGANVDLEMNWVELILRLRALDKAHIRFSFMVGGRLLDARVDARTTTRRVDYQDLFVLPEVGALLEARVYPKATLYGLAKYFNRTSKEDGALTFQLEGGLSYLLPAPNDTYVGWRVTGGVRYLQLEVTDRKGQPDQIRIETLATGPFIEVTKVF